MPDDVLVKISKVSDKGIVQIPFEIRQKLDLKPGTKMIVMALEDAVVLQKAEVLFAGERPSGVIQRLRSIFSRVPIRDIEE